MLVTLKYADQLLSEIEQILGPNESEALFPKYIFDIGPQESQDVRDGIAVLRKQMASALERYEIPIPAPHIGALHAVTTDLDYIDMELEELGPRSMRAYGELAAGAGKELEALVQELQAAVRRMLAYLRQRSASQ